LDEFADYNEYWAKRIETESCDKYVPRYDLVIKRIPESISVLDIGCGDGAFLNYLKKNRPNADVFGVDISSTAISVLRQRGLNGLVIDSNRPLRSQIDRDFDCVVLMEVLEHVHYADDLLRHTLNFHPKKVFVTIPNMGFILNRLRLLIGGRMPVTSIIFHMREHIRFWTVKDFIQWSGVLGFEVKSISSAYMSESLQWLNKTLVRWSPGLFGRQMVYELEPLATSAAHP
jgi:methionine biosynthesis protein MetW